MTATDLLQWSLEAMPCAFGGPAAEAVVRQIPEDFQVDELPAVVPEGEGEHCWLKVRKRGQNTEWVARQLARFAGVGMKDVGFAGLKDRHAVTTQWFSVRLPGRTPLPWFRLDLDGVEILETARHRRKLRRGVLRGNRFRLRLRHLHGDLPALESRLDALRREGFPNYFGSQRFGRNGANLMEAWRLFTGERRRVGRHRRGLMLSAVRAMLFNEVLGRRVQQRTWATLLPGDVAMLAGSHSRFLVERMDAELENRLAAFDLSPTGPLCGRGQPETAGEPLALESQVESDFEAWVEGCLRFGLERDRRPLRAAAAALKWSLERDDLQLEFTLAPGAYATSLLREALSLSEPAR